MTYQERETDVCKTCGQLEACSYYIRDLQRKCDYLQTIMLGWELGQKDTLDAVESYANKGNSEWTDNFMEGLRQALKDE